MFLEMAERLIQFFVRGFSNLLLLPGSSFSLVSLLSALAVAIAFLVLSRRPGKRRVTFRVLFRALFPKWLRLASFRADVRFLFLSVFAFGMLLGWAVLSLQFVSDTVARSLVDGFGVMPPTGLNEFTNRSIATLCLFLVYELAYWIDHYLSHRIPLLWEFHKVHHTAEVLSPLTNFRVHPVDSVLFYNILSIFLGATAGVLRYLQFGNPFVLDGANVIIVAFFFVTLHLQHSHVWMAATGLLGRVIQSPAHHQIHHSDNPIHFDKNFGGCLSIWDWAFGTLHMPERRRERLNFGIAIRAHTHHTAVGRLLVPFADAWGRLRSAVVLKKRSEGSAPNTIAVSQGADPTEASA
jgi:sterol desaturase/sphingolipid hydroxylase (fatty acid hydroxylase superfamily)